jgi:hypothetical protein
MNMAYPVVKRIRKWCHLPEYELDKAVFAEFRESSGKVMVEHLRRMAVDCREYYLGDECSASRICFSDILMLDDGCNAELVEDSSLVTYYVRLADRGSNRELLPDPDLLAGMNLVKSARQDHRILAKQVLS